MITEQDRQAADALYDWLIGDRNSTLSYLETVIAQARAEGKREGLEAASAAVNALTIEAREQADSMSKHYAGTALAELYQERHSVFLDAEEAIRALMEAENG